MFAVRFDQVSKRYRTDGVRYRSIRTDLATATKRLTGRASPNAGGSYIDAVDGLDMELEQGAAYAIVGRNGAGKSTALRLISRITYPSAGSVHVRGRVGALIEIGAGVHPELSGHENIWLYGSFLGLRRSEIRRRLDDIVDFSELGRQIDQQVKYYSTGMKLRLGFSIASFLEPDIFIVDESLAVGDGSFQTKCISRMHELGSEGRTVIFVSHETAAIEALCTKAVWLDRGRLQAQGALDDVLQAYNRSLEDDTALAADATDSLRILRATCHDSRGEQIARVRSHEPLTIRLELAGTQPVDQPRVQIRIADGTHTDLIECALSPATGGPGRISGRWTAECTIESLPLRPRLYQIWASAFAGPTRSLLVEWSEIAAFRVEGEADRGSEEAFESITGPSVAVRAKWRVL